jgi:hypothetical protein
MSPISTEMSIDHRPHSRAPEEGFPRHLLHRPSDKTSDKTNKSNSGKKVVKLKQ